MNQESRIHSLNVGGPRECEFQRKTVTSSIWKTPVEGPVAARGVNLEGDEQSDREVHGGPDKAVYAYAVEDIRWWEVEIGRSLELSAFGENLTTSGIDVSGALIGERWEIGTALFEVSQPRSPCWKLGMKMEDPAFPRKFTKAGRPGAYLRIVREGVLASGDAIRVVHRPGHGMRASEVFRIYTHDRQNARLLLDVPELAEEWMAWARREPGRPLHS